MLFPLFIGALLVGVWLLRAQLWQLFSSPENVRNWVAEWGASATLVFIGMQIVQVVVFIIPGEVVQIGGGYLFGVVLGTLWSLIGICAGSLVNWSVGRLLGLPFVAGLFGARSAVRFRRVIDSPNGRVGFLLFFLIPGIPKDILGYVAGAGRMPVLLFLLISAGGRLPALVGSTIIGAAAATRRWTLAIVLLSVATLLFAMGVIYREKLLEWVRRRTTRRAQIGDSK